jgi:hypothetical protein
MTDYTPPAEAAEAACRAVHPTRWEHRAIAHPCEECATAATAAGPIIAAEVRERVAREIEEGMDHDAVRNATLATAARIARGEES